MKLLGQDMDVGDVLWIEYTTGSDRKLMGVFGSLTYISDSLLSVRTSAEGSTDTWIAISIDSITKVLKYKEVANDVS